MNVKENEYTGIWIRIGDMQIEMHPSGYLYMVNMEEFIKSVQEKVIKECEKKQQAELKTAKAIAYDQGVAEAEERMGKIGCDGCKHILLNGSDDPCSRCSNTYPNLWVPKEKDDEIEFGDEVIDEYGEKGIVVSKYNTDRDNLLVLFDMYDVPQNVFKGTYKKTGKHYDLDAFMEELNG